MSPTTERAEARRSRYQGWLQTAAFLGAAAILGVVIYTSAVVQSNRRTQEQAATATVQTRAATAGPQRTASPQGTPETETWDLFQSTPLPTGMPPIVPGNAARVEEVARWAGRGMLNAVAWSPAGSVLAVGTTLGVYLYDPQAFQELRFLDTGGSVGAMAFSPDGQTLALVLGGRSQAQLWRVGDGTLLQTVDDVFSPYATAGFSPEGKLLLAWVMPDSGHLESWQSGMVTGSNSLALWQDGTETHLPIPRSESEDIGSPVVALSPDGRLVATGMPDGNVYLWQVADGRLVAELPAGGDFSQVAFSPSGRLLATGSANTGVRVWQTNTGTLLYMLEEGMTVPLNLAFAPDGRTLAVVGSQTVRLYGMDTGALVRLVEIPSEAGMAATTSTSLSMVGGAFSPDGQDLAVGLAEGRLLLFHAENGALLHAWFAFPPPWSALALSPDGGFLATRSLLDGTTWLWDVARGIPLRKLYSEALYIQIQARAVAFSSDGRLLATGEGAGVVLRQVADGVEAGRLAPGSGDMGTGPVIMGNDPAACVAFSPDGRWAAAGYGAGRLLLWQLPAGTLRWWTEVYTATAVLTWCNVAFSPSGQFLTASWPGSPVYVWHMPGETPVREWAEPQGWITTGATFSSNGDLLAFWGIGGEVYLWPFTGEEAPRILKAPEMGIGLAFSPDGQLLAGSSVEGPIYLWRVDDGTLLRTLEGHTEWVSGLVFSPDERLLFSASPDGTVRVWGVR